MTNWLKDQINKNQYVKVYFGAYGKTGRHINTISINTDPTNPNALSFNDSSRHKLMIKLLGKVNILNIKEWNTGRHYWTHTDTDTGKVMTILFRKDANI